MTRSEQPPSIAVAAGPEVSPGFHLWHAALAWKAATNRALAAYELTSTQFFVLGAVGWRIKTGHAAPTQAEVARFTGLDAMTTSQVVRALERADLVARNDDPHDTRSWRLSLTALGGRRLKEAAATVRAVDRRLFAAVANRHDLISTLRGVRECGEHPNG